MYVPLAEQSFLADKPQHFVQPSIPRGSSSLWNYPWLFYINFVYVHDVFLALIPLKIYRLALTQMVSTLHPKTRRKSRIALSNWLSAPSFCFFHLP